MGSAAEFRLMVECCRRAFRGGDPGSFDVPAAVDWTCFVQLAQFHRVQGLVWMALGEAGDALPPGADTALAADARAIAATNLAIMRECVGLNETFSQAGIPLLFLKGLTVGALA